MKSISKYFSTVAIMYIDYNDIIHTAVQNIMRIQDFLSLEIVYLKVYTTEKEEERQ